MSERKMHPYGRVAGIFGHFFEQTINFEKIIPSGHLRHHYEDFTKPVYLMTLWSSVCLMV